MPKQRFLSGEQRTWEDKRHLSFSSVPCKLSLVAAGAAFALFAFPNSLPMMNGLYFQAQPKPIQRGQMGVKLVHDRVWYDQQSQAGCCPYAVKLYQHRYGGLHHRCCTNRLAEIEPWRPVWTWTKQQSFEDDDDRLWSEDLAFLQNSSLLIQGDSLAEQHFLGILCYIWSQESKSDLRVRNLTLVQKRDPAWLSPGTIWEAKLDPPWDATIRFIRFDQPQVFGQNPHVYRDYSHVIVGGWHHGVIEPRIINQFLNRLEQERSGKPTFVVEALPSHFPGGSYIKNANKHYPPVQVWHNLTSTYGDPAAKPPPLCDSYALSSGDPNINDKLYRWTQNRSTTTIIPAADLFRHRGDANIGRTNPGEVGPRGRDCLHYCVAPGVLDALAMQTFATLYNQHQHAQGHSLAS